jgi:chitodextrinase
MTSEPSLNETSISTNIVVTDNCVVSADSIDEDQITSGNLIVEKSGNVYTLTFTFQSNDFETISGTYVGELELAQDLSD